jgi:hypothetical protein
MVTQLASKLIVVGDSMVWMANLEGVITIFAVDIKPLRACIFGVCVRDCELFDRQCGENGRESIQHAVRYFGERGGDRGRCVGGHRSWHRCYLPGFQ